MSMFSRIAKRLGRFAILFLLFVGSLLSLKYSFGIDPAAFGLELPRSLRRTSLDWTITTQKDAMTDRRSVVAGAAEDLDGGGEMEVTAVCGDAKVELQFVYFSPATRIFSRTDDNDSFAWDSIEPAPAVQITYRIDTGDPKSTVSRSKHRNEAELVFIEPNPSGQDILDSLFPKINELRRAETLRVKLPLLDGREPVIEIKPQARGLHEFLARCPLGQSIPPANGSGGTAGKGAFVDTAGQLALSATR